MPKPIRVGKRVIWDRIKIEAAFNGLDEENAENSIDRAVRLAGSVSVGGTLGAPTSLQGGLGKGISRAENGLRWAIRLGPRRL